MPLFLEKPLRRQAQVLRYVPAARRHSVLIDFVNGPASICNIHSEVGEHIGLRN